MKVSRLDLACISLLPLWGSQADERDEAGNLIIRGDIESQIQEIVDLAKIRNEKLKHVKGATNLGRKKAELPSSESLRLKFIAGISITAMAKEFEVCRKTIANRMREGGSLA